MTTVGNNRPEGLADERGPEVEGDLGDTPGLALAQDGPDGGSGGSGGSGGGINQPRLGLVGWLRFVWRQLTSMRTALLLLMLLAVGAIPGSIFPQNRIDPARVESYLNDHPSSGPWLQRLGAFDVYSSPWFSAIYLLLFISLIGCVVPRARVHWKAARAQPPRAPRRLEKMPACSETTVAAAPADVLAAARTVLKKRRYRIAAAADGDDAVSAERGHLAETGNLAFHLALMVLLFTVATGSFVAYSGQAVVVEGGRWSNQILQYDSFTPGRAVNTDDLPPFSLRLDSMTVKFDSTSTGAQFGAPREFKADVDYTRVPGGATQHQTIQVNDPLKVDGASVYLVGNGYAPEIVVRGPDGKEKYRSSVPFQPVDGVYTSTGVVKVPDGLSQQLGLLGQFLPTASFKADGQPISVFPDAGNPLLVFTAFTGDLGVNSGIPQSVYGLDISRMKQMTAGGKNFSAALGLGQTVKLPDNLGTVSFEGLHRYAAFDVRHDPTKLWVLIAAVTALIGLTVSLFVHRRRVWVRAVAGRAGRTVVQVAGLARSEDGGLMAEVENVLAGLLELQMKET
jgi:cytochrome c biogenesis protein